MASTLKINRMTAPGIYDLGDRFALISARGMVEIADRALGAPKRGVKGSVYQFGNNQPFINESTSLPTSNVVVDVSNYGPPATSKLGYYKSSVYTVNTNNNGIRFTPGGQADYGWTIRGGDVPKETTETIGNISTGPKQKLRQGPCPEGYFIPSVCDLNFFILILADIYNLTTTTGYYGLVEATGAGVQTAATALGIPPLPSSGRNYDTGDYSTSNTQRWRMSCSINPYITLEEVAALRWYSSTNSTYDQIKIPVAVVRAANAYEIRPFKGIIKF